jgi:primase-polymerase (primpol)-like protein
LPPRPVVRGGVIERGIVMQNLTRNKSVNFRVIQEEYDMIKRRQGQTGIKNLRHYLLKQAIDGRVIYIELDSVKECTALLGNISSNINQIARRVNSTGNVYNADMEYIKQRQDEIWEQQREILLDIKQDEKKRDASHAAPHRNPHVR